MTPTSDLVVQQQLSFEGQAAQGCLCLFQQCQLRAVALQGITVRAVAFPRWLSVVHTTLDHQSSKYLGCEGQAPQRCDRDTFSSAERDLVALQDITVRTVAPEVAFTGDTTSDFITDTANAEVLKAKLLIMECTFLDDEMSVEGARVRCPHLPDCLGTPSLLTTPRKKRNGKMVQKECPD